MLRVSEGSTPLSAKIVDRCGGCDSWGLDLPPVFFTQLFNKPADGRLALQWCDGVDCFGSATTANVSSAAPSQLSSPSSSPSSASPASSSSKSSSSSVPKPAQETSGSDDKDGEKDKRMYIAIGAGGGGLLLILIIGVCMCVRRRRKAEEGQVAYQENWLTQEPSGKLDEAAMAYGAPSSRPPVRQPKSQWSVSQSAKSQWPHG